MRSIYYYSTNHEPQVGKDGLLHYMYQITNNFTGQFYIGVHTQNPNKIDKYMGSGVELQRVYKEYGKQNFTKIIVEYFNTHEDAKIRESEIVTKNLTNSPECYNLINGGGKLRGGVGTISVKDKDGNMFKVKKDDPRWLSGELVGITKNNKASTTTVEKIRSYNIGLIKSAETKSKMSEKAKGMIACKDPITGEKFKVGKDDPRWISGELVGVNKGITGLISVKDKDGNTFKVHKDDPRWLSGDLVGVTKGLKASDVTKEKMSRSASEYVSVRDPETGSPIRIKKDDPRYLSGEYKCVLNGVVLSEESKNKLSNSKKGKVAVRSTITGECLLVDKDDPRRLSGELVGVNTGMVIVYDKDGNRMKVHNTDIRIKTGELIHKVK